MRLEKLTKGVTSAIRYLEDAMKTLSKGDDEEVSDLVWRAAAELEYSLFLFSLMHQEGSESSSWKLSLHSKDFKVNSVLESAKGLLEEVKSVMKAGEFHEAHKKTWIARGYLLRLQEFFEKRRKLKGATKKSS